MKADTLHMAETNLRGDVLELRQGKVGKRLRLRLRGDDGLRNAFGRLVDRLLAAKAHHQVRTLALFCNEAGQPLTAPALRKRFDNARTRAIAALEREAAGALSPLIAAQRRATTAAVTAFQFRDLRAKAGTDKAERAGERQAQKQLGHASITMTEHYLRDRRGDVVDPTG